mgnify:CR=1 FL=1
MNVQVISEKDLIKQLKKEVALLESKLQLSTFPVQSFPDELVLEKEIQIQKVQLICAKFYYWLLLHSFTPA